MLICLRILNGQSDRSKPTEPKFMQKILCRIGHWSSSYLTGDLMDSRSNSGTGHWIIIHIDVFGQKVIMLKKNEN